jgi:hypothetical protein
MKKILVIVLSLCCSFAFAQKSSGIVKGILEDGTAATKQPLEDATISVMNAKDSSLVSFTLTSNSGYFEIKSLDPGDYYMIVSYQGFATLKKSFQITVLNPVADLGEVKMDKAYKTLGEVVITDVAPIKIKGDTVEFNAGSFKTKPNASVEDLLKKLPGVQVEKDGTVKAQGENVQKVYVDGKEFFGSDPKLATKNLSADMVESVQVYDDMSEQAKFTKIDDGSRSKAINIKLKKDKKHGLFGKAMAGYGTDDRYDATLSLNKFDGDRQFSLIGAANNVNKQGFSFSDVISSMGGFGGMSRMGEGGSALTGGSMTLGSRTGGGAGISLPGLSNNSSGIAKSLSTGLNYRDVWGRKIDVSGSLFYSNSQTDRIQNSFTQYFKGDSTSRSLSNGTSENSNLRFNFRAEYRVDSMNSLLYTPVITFQNSNGRNYDSSLYMDNRSTNPYMSLSSQSTSNSDREGYSINQNLLFRHRFRRAGRTFTLGWNNSINNSDGNGSLYSPTSYYKESGSKSTIIQDQIVDQETRSHSNVFSSSYTEPIGRNKIIEVNYAHSQTNSVSDKQTFNYNPVGKEYSIVNAPETNKFDNTYRSDRVGANFRVQERKYNYQLGIGVQFGEQSNYSFKALGNKDTTLKQGYTNLFPTASFTYNFARSKNLRFNYRGRTQQPSATQLQNVEDHTNNFNWTAGNPGLKQEFNNTLSLSYNTFSMLSFRYWAANVSFSQTTNKIVNKVNTVKFPKPGAPAGSDSLQATLTRPINMNGAYTGTAFFTFGRPLKGKLKGSSINLNAIAAYNRNPSMFDDRSNYNNTLLLTQTVGINYNWKEKFDMGLNGNISFNNVENTLQKDQNTHYSSQTYSIDMSYTFKHNFILATDFDYFITQGYADGYNQKVPMWNTSFAKQFSKSKQYELKLSVNDILNNNQAYSRSTNEYSITDMQSNVLKQYFMLSFTYNINRMAGKNMMQMPRMMERQMQNIRVH